MKLKIKNLKHKKIIIFGIIAIAVILFVIFKPKEEVKKELEIETIEKRNLVTSIGATGKVETSTTKNIVSPLAGYKVKTVNVKEGQKISAGDVICTFDTKSLEENLSTAQKSLNISKAQGNLGIQTAKRGLEEAINNKNTQISNSQTDVNSALKAYQDSQNNLSNLEKNLTSKQTEASNLQKSYSSALATYTSIKNQYDELERKYSESENLYNAGIATKSSSEIEYNKYFKDGNQIDPATGSIINPADYKNGSFADSMHEAISTTFNQANSNAQNTEIAYNAAKTNYLNYKSTYENAKSTFDPINANYQSVMNEVQSIQNAVTTAKTATENLKTAYDKALQGQSSIASSSDSAIANMRDNITNAELSSNLSAGSQEMQIRTYQDQIKEGTVISNVSGTVTSVSVKVGDIYSGSVIAVVEGCDEFIIESEIDEYDIADIEVGMDVLIKTDSTRDEELKGKVVYTASSATETAVSGSMGMGAAVSTTGGDATYKVKIDLLSPNDRLRLGMNAKLSIITDSKENVLSIPYGAIHEKDDGTKYIEILKDEKTEEKEEIDVKVGFQSSYYTEIISDKIHEGMKVILPEVNKDNSVETLIKMMGADAGV